MCTSKHPALISRKILVKVNGVEVDPKAFFAAYNAGEFVFVDEWDTTHPDCPEHVKPRAESES